MLTFSNEPWTEKTKQNLETRTAEMKQQGPLKAVTNIVEISQMVDLHHWFYIANASSISSLYIEFISHIAMIYTQLSFLS